MGTDENFVKMLQGLYALALVRWSEGEDLII